MLAAMDNSQASARRLIEATELVLVLTGTFVLSISKPLSLLTSNFSLKIFKNMTTRCKKLISKVHRIKVVVFLPYSSNL